MNQPSRFPHSLVLIFAMVVLGQVLTYALPKGRYEREPLPSRGTTYVEQAGEAPLRQRLAAARAERQLDHAAVGRLFGVGPGTVQGWEQGRPAPGEPWRAGTHIEAGVGALLDRWVRTGTPPGAAELAAWKASLPGKSRVVPGGYQPVAEARALPWHAALTAIPRGFAAAADVIFFVFVVGGVIGVLRATGAIDALLGRAILAFRDRPVLLIAGITLLFAVGSSTIGMAEEYMPFVPLLVTLSLALRMDAVVGLGIVYVGAGVGYGCAALNPFTVLIAQDIAGVAPGSGWGFRVLYMLAALTVGIAHIVRYARRVQREPGRSLVADVDYSEGFALPADVAVTPARLLVIGLFGLAIGLFVYGVARWDWYFDELMAVFLGLALAATVVGRLHPNVAAGSFCSGAAEMTTTALLIGVARSIQVVLDEGQVIDTVIHGIAGLIAGAGPFAASLGMLGVQSATNFFIPSGSGQAYVTMPIMAPLADLCGVSRQTAVLAYQTGDGFMNMIVPTNALLMGMLALARIPFARWARFAVPLLLQLFLVATGALLVASWIGF